MGPLLALLLAASIPAECRLSAADKAANAALSFEDFALRGTRPKTPSVLRRAGCPAQAAEAIESYLADGPLDLAWRRELLAFELTLSLAYAGDERSAARAAALARRTDQQPDAKLDWNAYIAGVRAFLIKDRTKLRAARAALDATLRDDPKSANRINAENLARLDRCFERPFRVAMADGACRP